MNDKDIMEIIELMRRRDLPAVDSDDSGVEYVEITEQMEDLLHFIYGMNFFMEARR